LIRARSNQPKKSEQVSYDDILVLEIQKMAQDPARAAQVLDLFVLDAGMEMPKLSSIILYGGIKFPLSIIDFMLLQQLYELLKVLTGSPLRPREIKGSVETVVVDAFRLRTRCVHYIPSTVTEPVPTENSPHLTRKKLQEHKAVHDFLFGLAGGLKQFAQSSQGRKT
jgi:hypothetical protein